ncbi:MAG: type VI secretion system baseplate subunit TssF [Burkholderiales bacterium]|jgi:type VI secretion system protein ImpG|uniref:type VI secretion system baseplate subunit TssF n=1 Tax=Limnobacter sp. TaxID=2003368 RepID=UPI0039BD6170|nr:type VI secretion system baseplate subunit TssF [Burkholderiales bacterium]
MDPRLLQFYIQELAHVRDAGAEFAARFPKIASRLAMDATEVHDPYVERLLEGFAFLTARVQLRLHEEFPRFTEQLLNRISPNFLAPVPAMGVVQLNPNISDVALKKGIEVKAGTVMQSQVAKGIQTPCKFRVGHTLTLWPLLISTIEHGPFKGAPPKVSGKGAVRSALHLKIENGTQSPLSHLQFDSLDFHVSCGNEYAFKLFERITYQTAVIGIRTEGQSSWSYIPAQQLSPIGLNNDEALLPADSRQFSGTRLLQEFFAFPQRFLFFRIQGLNRHLSNSGQSSFELALCFLDSNAELDRVVGPDSLALNCTPVVNLFEHNCDRVLLDDRLHEVHVQPNRSKPLDFEVHSVLGVQGQGQNKVQTVLPLYGLAENSEVAAPHFVSRRTPTMVSEKQLREGGRSSYTGSEVFLGLTLPTGDLVTNHGFQQLAVRALCTNRDLPLLMPVGQGPTDLAWPGNLPLKSIRFLRGPSRPKAPTHNGQNCWQLIEHLSINYLGLMDQGDEFTGNGAAALTQLLRLHADPSQLAHQHMARAIQGVESLTTVARIVRQGRPAVVRGVQVTITIDELAMQGAGVAVLGAVLARYLAAHVSVNSFVQTRVKEHNTGAIVDFPAMSGNRPLL